MYGLLVNFDTKILNFKTFKSNSEDACDFISAIEYSIKMVIKIYFVINTLFNILCNIICQLYFTASC